MSRGTASLWCLGGSSAVRKRERRVADFGSVRGVEQLTARRVVVKK
eukprot:CAMPEP_0117496594 /NCGR_PEP_ID=MMETSP0784-20121206/20739_1 /TAXON_ID=39447 /ORGANISM="" /LENGTH=45 /DNA_ID= /DNA_START= /DNA_END= /DNA_ORIENTATION=